MASPVIVEAVRSSIGKRDVSLFRLHTAVLLGPVQAPLLERVSLVRSDSSPVVIAAMLSTTSAINATPYGTARLSWSVARSGELPEAFDKKVRDRPVEGLLIATVLTLVVANTLDLSRITLAGCDAFVVIFTAVRGAAARLGRHKARRALASATAGACLASLADLVIEERRNNLSGVVIVGGLDRPGGGLIRHGGRLSKSHGAA
jgi:hypothetical protein